MESGLSCQAEDTEDILNMVETLRVSSEEPEKCLDRILKFLLVEQDGECKSQFSATLTISLILLLLVYFIR